MARAGRRGRAAHGVPLRTLPRSGGVRAPNPAGDPAHGTRRRARPGLRPGARDRRGCITAWIRRIGHQFQVFALGKIVRAFDRALKELGQPQVIALTATATPEVRDDICGAMRGMADAAFPNRAFRKKENYYRLNLK